MTGLIFYEEDCLFNFNFQFSIFNFQFEIRTPRGRAQMSGSFR